jgi:hypothetical protein
MNRRRRIVASCLVVVACVVSYRALVIGKNERGAPIILVYDGEDIVIPSEILSAFEE